MINQSKSRQVFMETKDAAKRLIVEVLTAQGFQSQLDQYSVESEIGEGSCNPVYLAHHKLTGEKVAIKSMDMAIYQRLSREQRISEAEAMLRCSDSQHVLKLIESFTMDDKVYLVTKFAAGGDLLSYLDKEGSMSLPEDQARAIVGQIASGVRDMHSNNIVHRDLKHLNIFLSGSEDTPRVKIGDFGFATDLRKESTITKLAGTAVYMAPEILRNEPSDYKVDVWSLGVIMHTLLVSNLPFSGADREEVVQKTLNEELSYDDSTWEAVSAEAKDLVSRMLVKDAQARLSIEQVLSHPWLAGSN